MLKINPKEDYFEQI